MAVVTQDGQMDLAAEVVVEKKEKRMRPASCRNYMRKALSAEFEGIVAGFVAAAKKGSCPHVRLATELLQSSKKPSRKQGPVAKYWAQLEKEQLAKKQTEKAG